MAKLIDTIPLPQGLRGLNVAQLTQAAQELRDELIDLVSASGGHFASSLGATEISVALHRMFDAPRDRIVWDIGHQAYVHKMLTGRREHMKTIRTKGGIAGFLKRSESEYDAFGAGHAGTSISAAIGMRIALPEDRYVVSVIGDGSLTAGMVFEALNHAGSLRAKRFIVVLNDNQMSISPNVGAISWLFSKAVTSRISNFARRNFKDLYRRGYVPELVYKAIDRAEEATAGFLAGPAMLFEAFGFRYIGPVDGHDIGALIQAFEHAKTQDVPVLIHTATIKGKGYEPAEEDPVTWHGVTPFDRRCGQFLALRSAQPKKAPTYTAVFGDTLLRLAKADARIKAVTAAMPSGTGLDRLQAELPASFFDVGICEQHAVTFAAGMACEGLRPVCALYSTFLQRAYDQIVHDVCIQNLPVVFCVDRAGAVGSDGETHQGVFDVAYLRTLPNMVIMSPKDENELQHMLFTALNHDGPIALRYPRGNGVGAVLDVDLVELPIGRAEVLCRGADALCIAFGPLASHARALAAGLLSQYGISLTVINARFAKPLDSRLLKAELPRYPVVFTLEDHALQGGFGAAVLEFVHEYEVALKAPIRRFGVGDIFLPHATQEEQYQLCGYDMRSLREYVLQSCGRRLAAAG